MTRIRMVVLAALAVFAVSAVANASAFASEPELVNSTGGSAAGTTVTGEAGKATLQVKEEGSIICTKATNKGEVTGLKTGTGTTVFTGCEFAGLKCNTTGTAGEISVTTSFLAVYKGPVATAVPGVLTTVSPLTIKCGSTQTLVVEGTFLSAAKPAKELTTKGEFVAAQKEGKQDTNEYEETKGGTVHTASLVTTGTGTKAFSKKESGEEATLKLTFASAVELKA
jgi:hypothetical protein